MKVLITAFFIGFVSLLSAQQSEFMFWTKAGVSGKLAKKTSWDFKMNWRFGEQGLENFFPQVGVEYKLKKWFRPSIEYRYIIDKNKYGNYKSSNRVNLNIVSKFDVTKRLSAISRARFQYGYDRFGPPENYNADFDRAIRLKVGANYDIRKSVFVPLITSEFFYNPLLGEDGRQWTKVRFCAGTKLDFKKGHSGSVKYQFDKRFNDYKSGWRHVVAISYAYDI